MILEADDHRAIVIADEDEGLFACDLYGADVAYLAFECEALDRFRGEGAMAVIDQQGSEIRIVPAELDAVIPIVPDHEYIRQTIAVGVDDYCVAVGGQLCFPGEAVHREFGGGGGGCRGGGGGGGGSGWG